MPQIQYKKLCAIVESTKTRKVPLAVEIRGKDKDLILAITDHRQRTLATAPFNPSNPDQAAEDVARQLTLDGDTPHGM